MTAAARGEGREGREGEQRQQRAEREGHAVAGLGRGCGRGIKGHGGALAMGESTTVPVSGMVTEACTST